MSFIKRNIWAIGFVVILVGAFIAMWAAGSNTKLPSPNSTAKDTANITIDASDHVKGPANAKVTIVEWSDFQCPACKAYAPVVNAIALMYPNDVRIVYKHFPLKSIHLRAEIAARAAVAASMQGSFWEMTDKLFAGQETWTKERGTETFEKYAQELGLIADRFKQDLDSDASKSMVNEDYNQGLDLGINSTPTFYVNGKKIQNPDSVDAFKAIIEAELKTNNNQ